jgi:hypothetical protein
MMFAIGFVSGAVVLVLVLFAYGICRVAADPESYTGSAQKPLKMNPLVRSHSTSRFTTSSTVLDQ